MKMKLHFSLSNKFLPSFLILGTPRDVEGSYVHRIDTPFSSHAYTSNLKF